MEASNRETAVDTHSPLDLDLRLSEASLVIVHQVPSRLSDRFVEIQQEITAAAKQAPGYAKTEVYPPAKESSDQWVVVMSFRDPVNLEKWFRSPERMRCVSRLSEVGDFSIKKMPSGLGSWFAGLGDASEAPLPGWKMVLSVLSVLYPTAMLNVIYVNPWLESTGLAVTILIGCGLSVTLLQWVLMPPLTKALGRWLRTPFLKAPLLNLAGIAGIAAVLGLFALLFRRLAG